MGEMINRIYLFEVGVEYINEQQVDQYIINIIKKFEENLNKLNERIMILQNVLSNKIQIKLITDYINKNGELQHFVDDLIWNQF